MAWLGSGFSQITGQISNFTKEVLTEGTEEVDDHATELRLAKAKVNDLEGQHYNARVELERTKHLNDELRENLKSSELQIKATSEECRQKLKEQEAEIKYLKQQHHAVLEEQSKVAMEGSSSGLHSHSSSTDLHAFGGDEHDFDDVVSGQHQINRLQAEVDRLSAECRHWKKVAKSNKSSEDGQVLDGSPSRSAHADLHDQIKDLEQQLAREIDNHQDELAALQSLQSQKLAALNRKQADEKKLFEAKIEELQEKAQMAESYMKTKSNMEEVVKELRDENQQLASENELLSSRVSGTGDVRVVDESANKGWDRILPSSTPRHPAVRPGLQEAGVLELSFSEIQDKNKTGDDHQVQALQSQVAAYHQEISQFELERSDWSMEKEALESVLLKLRSELKSKEEQVAVIEAEQGLKEIARQKSSKSSTSGKHVKFADDSTSDIDIDELSYQVELLTNGNSMLEKERDALQEEKIQLDVEVRRLRKKLDELEAHLKDNKSQPTSESSTLSAQLEERDKEISKLKTQLKNQEAKISSLVSQVDEASESLIEKEAEIAELEERLDTSVAAAETIHNKVRKPSDEDVDVEINKMRIELQTKSKQIEQLSSKEKELDQLASQAQEREESFHVIEEEKKALESSLEELDVQHQEAIAAVMQSKEKLNKANEELKKRVADMENQLKEKTNDEPSNNEEINKLKTELETAQQELNRVQEERAQRNTVMSDLEEKLKKGALALNDLHMDKQELEGQVKELRNQVGTLTTKIANVNSEKSKLETSFSELEVKLHQTHEKLQSESTKSQINSGLQSDLQRLHHELNVSQQKSTDHNTRMAALEQEIGLLQDQLTSTSQDKLNISQSATDAEESYKRQIADLCKNYDETVSSLSEEINSLKSNKLAIERQLEQANIQLKEQAKSYEEYIQNIQKTKDSDASSLENEHQKLLKENHDKEMKVSELEVLIGQLKSEVERTRQELQTALDESQEASSLLTDKDSEISALQAQNEAYQEYLEKSTVKVQTLETEVSQLKSGAGSSGSEVSASKDPDALAMLEVKVKQLEADLSEKKSQVESYTKELTLVQEELGANKEMQVSDSEKLKVAQRQLNEELEKVQTLEATVTAKDSELKEREDQSKALTTQLEESKKSQGGLVQTQQNGHLIENQPIDDDDVNEKEVRMTDEEYETMRNVIQQKDKVILELRNNNSSLLKLLEDRSGNKSVLEIHTISNENKSLKMEKEQMISVLNDKTRECSNLKSEVHKLMNVISAEKTALAKLQKDNMDLLQQKDSSPAKEDPNADMTRDAVKTLSMVIRDKDLEIESLDQKNKTLLQVLQQSSGGAEVGAILQEKENLTKQLEMYQKDREQIIVALNQKHQEAVTYHSEISRLTVFLNQNSNKQEVLEREYSTLKESYEDKQQALLKLQNELLNYKQKFNEVDERYKEILHRQAQQVQEQVNEVPVMALQSFKPEGENEGDAGDSSNDQRAQNSSTVHIKHLNQILSQRKQEISELKEQLRQMNMSIQEKDRAISEHKRNLQVKDQILQDREAVIEKRNESLSEANGRVRESREVVRSKDLEISSLKKQKDSLAFQIKGLQTELTDLKQERDKMVDRADGVTSERTQLAEANARLSAAIGERDLEMNAMKEKVATLTAAVSLVGAEKGEVEQMLADTEAMQKAAQVLQGERDQAYASLQAVQADNTAMKQQMRQLAEREQKLQRELDRLRSHLLTIEEGYTMEALAAEEREKELRNKLATAEEKAMNSTNAVQNYSVEAGRQVESLQKQLHEIAEQRDRAFMDLSAAKDTASQYATSLTNLQMVLEQFQREREEHLLVETERYQRHLAEREKQVKDLTTANTDLTAQLEEATDALEAAQRLSEQIDRKEEQLAKLKDQVHVREDELKRSEMEIVSLTTSNEGKVDKMIIKNLFMGYFHTPHNNRGEVLLLLGKVLNFTKDELQEVGAGGGSGGWLGGIFKRTIGTVSRSPPSTPSKARSFFMDQSFSEMFVKFLERESSPQPTMRLPAEAMAREQQEKQHQQQQRKQPAFNPFAVPAHTINPATSVSNLSRSEESSHLLMNPMGGSLSMLTPMVTTLATDSRVPQPTLAPQLPGRSSTSSSGRSTPASTSAILKDVLQQ